MLNESSSPSSGDRSADFNNSSQAPAKKDKEPYLINTHSKNVLVVSDLTNTLTADEPMMREIWENLCRDITYANGENCADRINFKDIWDVLYGVDAKSIHKAIQDSDLIPATHRYTNFNVMYSEFVDSYLQRIENGELKLRGQIAELLASLKHSNIDVIVVTNTPADLTRLIFQKLGVKDEEGNISPYMDEQGNFVSEHSSILKTFSPSVEENIPPKPDKTIFVKALEWAGHYDVIVGLDDAPMSIKGMNEAFFEMKARGHKGYDTIIQYANDLDDLRFPMANHLITPDKVSYSVKMIIEAACIGNHNKTMELKQGYQAEIMGEINISPYVYKDHAAKVEAAFTDNHDDDVFSTHLSGTIKKGHQVASGMAKENPFGGSTIEQQFEPFKLAGLDIQKMIPDLKLGTINIDVPNLWALGMEADVTIKNAYWGTVRYSPEDFSFFQCRIKYQDEIYKGYVYYPSPFTKVDELDPNPAKNTPVHNHGRFEFLGSEIPNIEYGQPIEIWLKPNAFMITELNDEFHYVKAAKYKAPPRPS